MKGLIQIYIRYLAMAIGILLGFLALMLAIVIYEGNAAAAEGREGWAGRRTVQELSESLSLSEDGSVAGTDRAEELLKLSGAEFAMLLSGDGRILWSYRLPAHLNHRYTVGEAAQFSRWYLDGRPVFVWNGDSGLMVAAYPEGSIWRFSSYRAMEDFERTRHMAVLALWGTALMVLFLILIFGWLYSRKLRALSLAVREMASGGSGEELSEKNFGELALSINETGRRLALQKQLLDRRDEARTEWISGVSHDIRTPLSLVMGYAEILEKREGLDGDSRKKALIIKEQAVRIRDLIEDLNLASKLEYNMQPLRKEKLRLAPLIRQAAADCLNAAGDGGEGRFEIELSLSEEFDSAEAEADRKLLLRAVENVIGNSIRHNPKGCRILVEGAVQKGLAEISVTDTGKGIDKEIADCIRQGTGTERHIMGLRIVGQIAAAHEGEMEIRGSHTVSIRLPLCPQEWRCSV